MQLYQDYDLMIYFYIYSFFGWICETIVYYIWKGKYNNRGFLNQPLILIYGLDMILLIVGSGVSQTHLVFQFMMNIFRVIIVRNLSTFVIERISGNAILSYSSKNEKRKKELSLLLIDICSATVLFAVFKLCHPFIYLGISFLPATFIKIICFILMIFVFLDFISMIYSFKKIKPIHRTNGEKITDAFAWQEKLNRQKTTLGYRLADQVHKRLEKIYPDLYKVKYEGIHETDVQAEKEGIIFAKGVCFDKLIWVFLLSSLLGDGIETIYVRMVGGVWMRRSGVVFGPFSIVWGIGAVLLTIILYRYANKNKLHVFLGGFLLGGTYEYMASVILETLFHVRFWDYSNMPLNVGGRTNLPYMMGWGILSMVWICLCYPAMSHVIEKIPPFSGKVFSYFLIIAMLLDLFVTGAVMLRYNTRKEHAAAENQMEKYMDIYYTDEDVESMWPNLTQGKKN